MLHLSTVKSIIGLTWYRGIVIPILDTDKVKKTHEQDVMAIVPFIKDIFEHQRAQIVAKWKHKEIST